MAVQQMLRLLSKISGTEDAVPVLPVHAPDVIGNITASGQSVTITDCRGTGAVTALLSGTFAGTNLTFEASKDGTTWYPIVGRNPNLANPAPVLVTGVLTTNTAVVWEVPLLLGFNQFRVRATAHTSGTLNVALVASSQFAAPIVAATHIGGLASGSSRIGSVSAPAIGYTESTTTLAANGTVTGTSRDVLAATSAAVSTAGYPTEVRVSASANITGTLALEVSNDGTTWFRIKTVATVQASGGVFYAEISHRPTMRYARAQYTNSNAAQGSFSLNTLLLG